MSVNRWSTLTRRSFVFGAGATLLLGAAYGASKAARHMSALMPLEKLDPLLDAPLPWEQVETHHSYPMPQWRDGRLVLDVVSMPLFSRRRKGFSSSRLSRSRPSILVPRQ